MGLPKRSLRAMGVLCGVFASSAAAAAPQPVAVTLESGRTDVVIEKKASPVVKFAASEATNFLSRVFGARVPIVNAPREGCAALVLGMNEWSRAAGIDPDAKPTDTYFIRTAPGRVYLAGRDGRYDPVRHPAVESSEGQRERATLFAVYAFLEEFAGCRFYFPGEMGEVVPRAERLAVRETDVAVTPDCLVRRVHSPKAAWYDDGPLAKDGRRLDWLRKRFGTTRVDCCHGTRTMKFPEKYARTHPEYFALREDGARCIGGQKSGSHADRNGMLCYSNPGLRQAVFEECVRQFAGGAKHVDIMPNDGYTQCMCEGCQRMYRHDDPRNFASELIWDYTADIAGRLKKAGLSGKVTQMAYWPYQRPPAFEIPDNVEVMVAEKGPYSVANRDVVRREYDEIRAWSRKLGRRVWIWTYPHKWLATDIPGVPDFTPRAVGEYYKAVGDVIFGTFMEAETDRFIFHYLGDYVLSRVLWDVGTDVNAVIDEHNRLMFGGGAGAMSEFFDLLERKWICGVCGDTTVTDVGPVTVPPSSGDLWTKTYSPAVMSKLDALLKEAAGRTDADSVERRRVEFMRRQLFDPLAALPAAWREQMAKVEALRWRIADGGAVALRPFANRGAAPSSEDVVKTSVTARRTDSALVFEFDCEEPGVSRIVANPRTPHDTRSLWRQSGVEVFLNPSGDRMTVYHLIVNASGVVCDGVERRRGGEWFVPTDVTWESGATADVKRRPDGYTLTLSVPLASLGPGAKDAFPAEFCRNRVLKDGRGNGNYIWGAYSRGYKDTWNYGTLVTK